MKLRNLLLLSALAIAGMGCSNDSIDGEIPVVGAANELQLVIGGNDGSVDYTKAIASESENKIDNLDVYLFASDAQGGTYRFLEKWASAATNDKVQKTFVLQPSGSEWNASIFPSDIQGYPYLKLFMVANREAGLFKEDGATALETLTAFTDAGTFDNATEESAFLQSYTQALTPDQVLKPSLLMTGSNTTKMLGTVSKVKIELKRAVARFDIDNTARSSNLTIESIGLKQGRKTAPLWPTGNITPVADGDLGTSTLLTEYSPVAYTDLPNANQGVTESAIYVYPTLSTDKAELIIKGKYYNPVNNTKMDATYNVPLQKTAADGTTSLIPINRNSRYKLRIIDVTTTTMAATFEIEDWTSGGGISVKPENSAPYYTLETLFGDNPGNDKPGALYHTTTNFRPYGSTTFKLVMAATGKTSVVKSLRETPGIATKATGSWSTDWLDISSTAPTYETKDGIVYTTFTVSVPSEEDMNDQPPVSLHFINEAASLDPDLETVLTFYARASDSKPAMADAGGHSAGNTVDFTDNKAVKATMSKTNGSTIRVKVDNFEGITVQQINDPTLVAGAEDGDIVSPEGFSIKEVAREALSSTYEIKITDADKVGSDPVVAYFTYVPGHIAASTLTINAIYMDADANKVTLSLDGCDQGVNPVPTINSSTGYIEAYMFNAENTLGNNQIQLRITSPNGIVAENQNSDRVTVTKGDNGIYTLMATSAAQAGANYQLKFKSAVDPDQYKNVNLQMMPVATSFTITSGNITKDGSSILVGSLNPGTNFEFYIEAPKGSSITLPTDCDWLSFECAREAGFVDGKTKAGAICKMAITASPGDSQYNDVTITVRNAVKGSDDIITIKKKETPL